MEGGWHDNGPCPTCRQKERFLWERGYLKFLVGQGWTGAVNGKPVHITARELRLPPSLKDFKELVLAREKQEREDVNT